MIDCQPKFIKKGDRFRKKPNSYEQNKYMTWDFETFPNQEGQAVPYAIGLRHGVEESYFKSDPGVVVKIFYLADYTGDSLNVRVKAMVADFMAYIIQPCFSGYRVYAHNFGRFDGPILLNYVDLELYKIKPIYSNNILYQLSVSGSPCKIPCKIYMRDSLLLMPGSLDKLARGLGVKTKKGDFPHSFACEENLNYKGVSPCGSSESWDFRVELESYLKDDVNALFEIFHEFCSVLARQLGVDALKSLTAPALALETYIEKYSTM
jgi:hypothetical protein